MPQPRQNLTAQTTDDKRTTLEMVDVRTGAQALAALAPENPALSVFCAQRVNVPPRQMVVDSQGIVYALTVSGLSVIPLTPAGAATRPQIAGGSRGIVNSTDGTPNFKPGAFITVNGVNLAAAATEDQLPPPTLLGGSCVVFNDVALPLLSTSPGQISAQLPSDIRPGINVVQVRSLATAQARDPVVVTVERP